MKNTFKYIGFLLGLVVLFSLGSCEDDIPPVIEELKFDRVFTPLELEVKISNQTTAIFSWGENKGIDSYVLEISDDSLEYTSIIHTATVAPDEIPYIYDLPAGDTGYSVRVKGTSSTASESKWATLAFKSLPENLFNNYDVFMSGLGQITVSWTPGKAVTSMVFITESGQTSFDISAEEMAAGMKTFTDLPNAAYQIHLMNNLKVRGFQSYVMEGDVLLDSGADLAAAIAAASAGDVIVLQAGGGYGFIGDLTIDKSLKIKGLDGALPVVYLTSGDRMFYIGSNLTPSDSLVFEKLYMSGFVGADSNNSQIRGVFDMESEACDLGVLKFQSCKLFDMGRQILRLRGGADQTIDQYLIDDCIIHNLGNSSASYGVLCGTATNTNVHVFKISNSTIDSLKSHFIRYDVATDCSSITVENCTFDKVPFSSGRYLMDLRSNAITEGVFVTNCIFGNNTYGTDPSISGIRTADGVTLEVTNSYATTDFVNSGYSIVELCTSTGLSSSELWVNPDGGDFSFRGSVIEAGDPRWY